MERWLYILRVHDSIFHDRRWSAEVRIDTCRVLRKKMLELGDLNQDDTHFLELLENFRTGK